MSSNSDSSPSGHSTTRRHHPDHDDIETHYSGLERAECPFCFHGYVTITLEEDGIEHEEAVPCKHCGQATELRMGEERRE
jgi:transcription elongation factor Elf1